MISSNKRLAKIKKELENYTGKLIVITFEDGCELKVAAGTILDSLVRVRNDEETEFIKTIRGKEIVSCSGCELLISIIKQLAEHRDKESDDIPNIDKLAEGYLNDPERPYKDFSNNELKEIINCCED